MKQGLRTQLRHLIELLDGAVQQAYADAGLDYRITQPAVTQQAITMLEQRLFGERIRDASKKVVATP